MIIPDDVVAEEDGDPGQRVAQDSAANVSHVHRLRHVRRTEIDHDAAGRFRGRYTEARVPQQFRGPGRDNFGPQGEVNEPGTCNRRRLA